MKKTIVCSLVCCGLLFAGCGSNKTNTTPDNTGANTIVTGSTDTGHVYTNDQYGFRFEYPASATVTGQFARFYILATGWMSEDQESASGTLLISVINGRIENESSYPRYYDAETRIGISTGIDEVANCTKNIQQPDVIGRETTINNIVFTVYPIQDAAMMQYMEGMSYRTVHNNTCYIIEQLKTGSSYRDTPTSGDIADSVLDGYYTGLDTVIQTFSFTP